MKNRNQSTYPIYHSNSNNTNNIYANNTNSNNNSNSDKTPSNTYSFNEITYTQQQQQNLNHNQQRQHSNRNRCQVIPPQQFLLPTQNQIQNQNSNEQRLQISPTNYQQQDQRFLPTAISTNPTTMSSLTTSNFLQNQFTNLTNSHQFAPYPNQQQQQQHQQTYQQQLSNVNRNQLAQQQQQMLQQQQNQQQQQTELQYQRRQQLQLPLFSESNSLQQFQQNQQSNQQQQRRQLFENQQQLIGNIRTNNLNSNSNNNNKNNNYHHNNTLSASSNGNDNEKFSMDATEIANFLANELFMQQLVSVDGIQSGVPTLTTSTLTPTLLKSIEETFTELIEDPVTASFQAGFIPPTYPSTSNNATSSIGGGTFNGSIHDYGDTESEDSRNSLGPRMYGDYQLGGETTDNSSATTDSTSFQNGLIRSSLATSNSNSASTNDFSAINVAIAAANSSKKSNNANTSSSATSTPGTTTTTRRNQGGRRPAKPSNLTPEEEEKRRVRRERNKLAAARCRKRRVDLTNDLLDEVSQLEKKREGLQRDVTTLNTQKQELEKILEVHRMSCQKVRDDLMTVTTFNGLIGPNNATTNNNITGIDTTLASTGRSSPIDLKPEIIHDNLLAGIVRIKNEPIENALDGNSLDHDGPSSPKRMLLTRNNPMVPPPLPKIGTLSPSLAAAASLNTPIVTTAPVSFANMNSMQNNNFLVHTLNPLNKPLLNISAGGGNKQRPTTLPTMPRNAGLGLNVDNKAPMDINGVAIQTPSTGMFNFDSLMDGGTGLTPVSGPLVPTCSSQNKHPLELTTPTSEPSKLVSL